MEKMGAYNMNQELKPCPFCGGKAKIIKDPIKIGCTNNNCMICVHTIPNLQLEDAIEAWNRRVNDTENT